MKRLAVLTLAAGWVWGASASRAADWAPLPPPTGYAPTAPRVPAPAVYQGTVVPVATTAPAAGAVQLASFWNGPRESIASGDWCRGPRVWCSDCAPAVRFPLPALPAAAPCGTTARLPAAKSHDGHCWDRFKEWLCFSPTPYRFGLVPTNRMPPPYTYFLPTAEGPGNAGSNCGPHGCAAHPRLGGHAPARGCTTCPTPGEAVMPGFRLAAPTHATHAPYVQQAPAPQPAAAPVQPAGAFRIPTAAVPYKPAGR